MLASHKMIRVLFLLLLFPAVAGASPLGRSFTYQGHLSQSGTPVEGTVTLRFSLWDMAGTGDPPTGGVVVGGAQTVTNVPISGGLFSVQLNAGDEFGAAAFDGEARWLQVEVCTDGTCTSSTVLGPRQPMTAAPYALYSLAPWELSGTGIGYNGGDVGIGTTTPAFRLDVRGGAILVENLGDQADLLWLASERSWVFRQEGGGAGAALKLQSIGGGGNKNFIVQTDGFMGVGTTSPAEKLDVRGNIKLGGSGQYFAPGGVENLRLLRGRVSSTGAVLSGTGFTVTQINAGIYNIQFNTAFPTGQSPIVTASAESLGSALFAVVSFTTTTQASVRIFNAAGTATSSGFFFITAGTR